MGFFEHLQLKCKKSVDCHGSCFFPFSHFVFFILIDEKTSVQQKNLSGLLILPFLLRKIRLSNNNDNKKKGSASKKVSWTFSSGLPETCKSNYCRLLYYHNCNFILLTRNLVTKIYFLILSFIFL